ncbi:MAG: hypothetical protein IKI17_00270 [Oscillospiraceae bacterium]|nr:hypothetical protein [Oscillospiraceae bacterium]
MDKQADKAARLDFWRGRLERAEAAYAGELARMERRERQFRGDRNLSEAVPGDRTRSARHVRNLSAELIEAQVDASIPAPRVTARRREDEALARVVEDMLRNEMDRLPMEQINDLMERMVPVQGGAAFLVDWDSGARSHTALGEVSVMALHPRQLIPQDGVWDALERADYLFLKLSQTRESLRRRYGLEVDGGDPAMVYDPETGVADSTSDEVLTQYVAYYRNAAGGVGRFSWAGDTVLEDAEDYQARQGDDSAYEELWTPILRPGRETVPGAHPVAGENGETVLEPTRIPCYRPGIYPVILQKNVSAYGRFLGESDLDKIADQQRTANRIESKIIDKLLKSGSYITLPDDAGIRVDTEDMKVIRPGSHQNKELIGVYDLQGNIQQDLVYLAQVYEEARQAIGITDSFQGRRDATATSGRAKEFAAAQAAGRMESKRVMKQAAYAALYEAIFRFRLAYAEEPRPVVSADLSGGTVYSSFNRYDFLERDAAGDWCWNDRFLFSCDASAPLAGHREALWQETRMNLQTGAFGDPGELDTLILFWTKMRGLHYPLAEDTLAYLKERRRRGETRSV